MTTDISHLLNYDRLTYQNLEEHQSIMVDNVLHSLERATNQDINTGYTWYSDAHNYAHQLADQFDLSVDQAAGIIAALSPGISWGINKRAAEDLIADPYVTVPGYGYSKRKAQNILFGAHVEKALRHNNPDKKSYHFYVNILNPLDYDYVTLDMWAIRAILGNATIHRNLTPKLINTPHKYNAIANVFKSLADHIGQIPNVIQAISWTYFERQFGVNWQWDKVT